MVSELASVPLICSLAIAQAVGRVWMKRLGDIAQWNAVTHCKGPFTDHFPGICTQNCNAKNPPAAAGKHLNQANCVLLCCCAIDLVKGQAIDRETRISLSECGFGFAQGREIWIRECAYDVMLIKRSRNAKNCIRDRHPAHVLG
jgi:hypothetical protein